MFIMMPLQKEHTAVMSLNGTKCHSNELKLTHYTSIHFMKVTTRKETLQRWAPNFNLILS